MIPPRPNCPPLIRVACAVAATSFLAIESARAASPPPLTTVPEDEAAFLERWRTPSGAAAAPLPRLSPDLVRAFDEYRRANGDSASLRRALRARVPAMRVDAGGRVLVHASGDDPATAAAALLRLGATGVRRAGRTLSGWIPAGSLALAAYEPAFRLLRPAYAITHVGTATTQGDVAIAGPAARAGGLSGAGIVVGVLSDSFDCRGGAAAGVASGDLPVVNVLKNAPAAGCGGLSDEGRAMAEIVHDVAPGASIAFYTAFDGLADFAAGIRALHDTAGARVIVDDVVYLDEPMFQDGPVAQAVDAVVAAGSAYFSAAGNQGTNAYESAFRVSSTRGFLATSRRHDFDAGAGTTTRQPVSIPPGATVTVVLQWNQPFFSVSGAPGAQTDLDLLLYRTTDGALVAGSTQSNVGNDPIEIFQFTNPATSTTSDFGLQIDLRNASTSVAPARMRYAWFGSMTPVAFGTSSPTLSGHANAAGARAVAAANYRNTPAFGTSPAIVESYSSRGGVPILFTTSGAATLIDRQKPELTAPDGGDTTFFGTDTDGTGRPNFFGTSAAAPHAAAAATLLLQSRPALTPAGIGAALADSALEMTPAGLPAGIDASTGSGLVQVDTALVYAAPTGAVGFAALPDGTPVATSFAGSAYASRGVTLVASDRGDGAVSAGPGPVSLTASGFAGNVALVSGSGASLRLDFSPTVNAASFAFATASGLVDVDLLAPDGSLLRRVRAAGTEAVSFAGTARLAGRADVAGFGTIAALIVRTVPPDTDLRVDDVRFGTAAPGVWNENAGSDAPLPAWSLLALATALVGGAARRLRRSS